MSSSLVLLLAGVVVVAAVAQVVRFSRRRRELIRRLARGTVLSMVELQDLNPRGSAESPHRARVAMTFPAKTDVAGIFLVAPDLSTRQVHPPHQGSPPARLRALLSDARVSPPPCPLSLTLTGTHGLAYLEPLVTGSVKSSDLDYLVDVAARIGGSPAAEPRGPEA